MLHIYTSGSKSMYQNSPFYKSSMKKLKLEDLPPEIFFEVESSRTSESAILQNEFVCFHH